MVLKQSFDLLRKGGVARSVLVGGVQGLLPSFFRIVNQFDLLDGRCGQNLTFEKNVGAGGTAHF